jgi:hypothetical protein
LWLVATFIGGVFLYLLAIGEVLAFFGEVPTQEEERNAAILATLGNIGLVLGPLGCYYVFRTRAWLITAILFGLLGAVPAGAAVLDALDPNPY